MRSLTSLSLAPPPLSRRNGIHCRICICATHNLRNDAAPLPLLSPFLHLSVLQVRRKHTGTRARGRHWGNVGGRLTKLRQCSAQSRPRRE
jgi:hypothetical protein